MTTSDEGKFGGVPLASNGMPVWLMDVIQPPEDAVEPEKFTAVVSNPPYQISVEGNKISQSVYPFFMEAAQFISQYISMVYPFRWALTGESTEDFRKKELLSKKYLYFCVQTGARDLFETAYINGGTNILLWSEKPREYSKMNYKYDDLIDERENISNNSEIFIPYSKYSLIQNKIRTKNKLDVSSFSPYGEFTNITKGSLFRIPDGTGLFLYVSGGKQFEVPFSITKEKTSDYKVFTTCTAHRKNNSLARLDRIFLGNPKEICTTSFLKIGSYETEQEAINTIRYLKTDFANFLLGIACPTQNAMKKVYSLIPNVNFETGEIFDKPGVFLDFSKPESLDDQLAEIYGLTDDERYLMTKDLKPWKDKVDVDADR